MRQRRGNEKLRILVFWLCVGTLCIGTLSFIAAAVIGPGAPHQDPTPEMCDKERVAAAESERCITVGGIAIAMSTAFFLFARFSRPN